VVATGAFGAIQIHRISLHQTRIAPGTQTAHPHVGTTHAETRRKASGHLLCFNLIHLHSRFFFEIEEMLLIQCFRGGKGITKKKITIKLGIPSFFPPLPLLSVFCNKRAISRYPILWPLLPLSMQFV
jgi:hypothetical protein